MSARGTLTSSTCIRRMLRRFRSIARAPVSAAPARLDVAPVARRRRGETGARKRTWQDCQGLRLRTRAARPPAVRRMSRPCLLSGCRAGGAPLAANMGSRRPCWQVFSSPVPPSPRPPRRPRHGRGRAGAGSRAPPGAPRGRRAGCPPPAASARAGLEAERQVAEEQRLGRPAAAPARRTPARRARWSAAPGRGTRRSAPRCARRRRRAARSRAGPGRARRRASAARAARSATASIPPPPARVLDHRPDRGSGIRPARAPS